MNELVYEFITQCQTEQTNYNHTYIETLYNELKGINKLKRQQLETLSYSFRKSKKIAINRDYNEDELQQQYQVKDQLMQHVDRLYMTINHTKIQSHGLIAQIKLQTIYTGDIMNEERKVQQLKALSYISYNNYKLNTDELLKKLELKRNDKQHIALDLDNELKLVQQKHYTLRLNIKEAQCKLQQQVIYIQELMYVNAEINEKLALQKESVIQLKVLQKLEKMFITYEEPISEQLNLNGFKDSEIYRIICDFMQSHPFGIKYLITELLEQYTNQQVQLESEIGKAQELLILKQVCLNEIDIMSSQLKQYRQQVIPEDGQKFHHFQRLQEQHQIKLSQNNFKLSMIHRAEGFIMKIYQGLLQCTQRCQHIIQMLSQKQIGHDVKLYNLENKFKQLVNNYGLNNQITLTYFQFLAIFETTKRSDINCQQLYQDIQQSSLLRIYVNEQVLYSFLNTGLTQSELFNKATDYYLKTIMLMIEIFMNIAGLVKKSKYSMTEIPMTIRSKSNTKLTLKTESDKLQLGSLKTKPTKRHSFASTLVSSKRYIDMEEDVYQESVRQKIMFPQSSRSSKDKIISEQMLYCTKLAESERGHANKQIIQNFKSLVQLRKLKSVKGSTSKLTSTFHSNTGSLLFKSQNL